MKKFRIKDLTVAVDGTNKCGHNFSNPICTILSEQCLANTFDACAINLTGCGRNLTGRLPTGCGVAHSLCGRSLVDPCLLSGGCGLNFSTQDPNILTQIIQSKNSLPEQLELIEVMKSDLNVALKNLDQAEKELQGAAVPTTLSEAEAVKVKLEGALKEVTTLMKKLK